MNIQAVNLIQLSIEELSSLIKNAVKEELKVLSQSSKTDEDQELLTRDEAKNLLRVSFTTLWKYNKNKTLEAKKLGNKVYYLKSDIMNLINSNL